VTATITVSGKQIRSASEWTTEIALKPVNGALTIQIAPGGIAIVEIVD
jgi:hypothetical protein